MVQSKKSPVGPRSSTAHTIRSTAPTIRSTTAPTIRSTISPTVKSSTIPTIRSQIRSTMSSHPEQVPHRRHRLQVIFRRKTEERQIFMEDLYDMRMRNYRENYGRIRKSIGPKWFQVFSVVQLKTLKTLEYSMHQDLLEGRPVKTMAILKTLGVVPRPKRIDVLRCLYIGRNDPKEFCAVLFSHMFGHDFSATRNFGYSANARLILSAIYYLGRDALLSFLAEKFKTPVKAKPKPRKKVPVQQMPLKSPYLQELEFKMPCTPYKPKRPDPLPDLDFLNDAVDFAHVTVEKPPPPPPPPPPRKRLQIPRYLCDKMAGYQSISPPAPQPQTFIPRQLSKKKLQASRLCIIDVKKKEYGLGGMAGRTKPPKKPKAPSIPDLPNLQYSISGVYSSGNKTFYIIGGVHVLPSEGYLKHGGHRLLGGELVRIHEGVIGVTVPPKARSCDCLRLRRKAIDYVKKTKCRCEHHYDYGNDGMFDFDEPPYFERPTALGGYKMNYNTIYELDQHILHVKKETQRIWETESILQDEVCKCDAPVRGKKVKKQTFSKKPSESCLGDKPKVQDYLRCALRLQQKTNLAARLPELHLMRELREWVRRRFYGDFSKERKKRMLKRSTDCWVYLNALQDMGLGKESPEKNNIFRRRNTWKYKSQLEKKFRKYTAEFRLKLYRAHLFFNNLFWATMCHAQYPDKRFRDIFFCYLVSKVSDVTYMHPYDKVETINRMLRMKRKRYRCLPDKVDDLDFE